MDDFLPTPMVGDQIDCGHAGFDNVARIIRPGDEPGEWVVETSSGLVMLIGSSRLYQWASYGLCSEDP